MEQSKNILIRNSYLLSQVSTSYGGSDYIVNAVHDNDAEGDDGNKPWMVKLQIKYEEGKSQMIDKCTGSVINTRFIMTAAHCFCKKNPGTRWNLLFINFCRQPLFLNCHCRCSFTDWCTTGHKIFKDEVKIIIKSVGSIKQDDSEDSGGFNFVSEAEAYHYEDQLLDRRDPVVEELFVHPDR